MKSPAPESKHSYRLTKGDWGDQDITTNIHHLTKWSLKAPLCSWWRMSGMMQEKMSQWGKSAQNGENTSWRPSSLGFSGPVAPTGKRLQPN